MQVRSLAQTRVNFKHLIALAGADGKVTDLEIPIFSGGDTDRAFPEIAVWVSKNADRTRFTAVCCILDENTENIVLAFDYNAKISFGEGFSKVCNLE